MEPEPKVFECWSRSLKFEFRLHSPASGCCSLRYKNAFAKKKLFCALTLEKFFRILSLLISDSVDIIGKPLRRSCWIDAIK